MFIISSTIDYYQVNKQVITMEVQMEFSIAQFLSFYLLILQTHQ